MRSNLNKISFALSTLAICICAEAIQPALAQSTSISNVSQDVFRCMKNHTRSALGWVVYEGSDSGRIKVYATGVGQVGEVSYNLDANQGALNLTYVRGPAPFTQIQSGLSDTATRCRSGEYN